MNFSTIFLKLNKLSQNPSTKQFIINKNKKNLNFFILLLKLNIVRKIITQDNKIKIILNYNTKLKFIFFSKKNQLIFLKQNKIKKLNKINLYIYTTSVGFKSSLNCNEGGQIITKIIF